VALVFRRVPSLLSSSLTWVIWPIVLSLSGLLIFKFGFIPEDIKAIGADQIVEMVFFEIEYFPAIEAETLLYRAVRCRLALWRDFMGWCGGMG